MKRFTSREFIKIVKLNGYFYNRSNSKKGILIKVFNTIVDASRELKIPTTNISKCCKGLRKSAGNFIWKYGQL